MNFYENIVIINGSLGDEEIKAATEKVKNLITGFGGEILKAEEWGKKKLAYEVKKQKKGFYLFLIFKAPSAAIKKIEDYYRVYDPIIKHMVLRLGKKQIEQAQKSFTGTESASPSAEQKTGE